MRFKFISKIGLLLSILLSNTCFAQNIWTGTGFAVSNGYIITNQHVIEGASDIRVYGINGNLIEPYNAIVKGVDKTNDLAIIQIKDDSFKGFGQIPYSFKKSMAEVGEDVFVLGYPMTDILGNEIKLTNGIISSRSGYQGDISTYQISAPIQPGNSGGPLFDKNGYVIGVVNAGVPDAQNVGYAIKMGFVENLIDTVISSNLLKGTNQITSLPLSQKVSMIRPFVYCIVCSDGCYSNSVSSNTNKEDIFSKYISQATYYREYSGDDFGHENKPPYHDYGRVMITYDGASRIVLLHYRNKVSKESTYLRYKVIQRKAMDSKEFGSGEFLLVQNLENASDIALISKHTDGVVVLHPMDFIPNTWLEIVKSCGLDGFVIEYGNSGHKGVSLL